MTWRSRLYGFGAVMFPAFTSTRVLMMPFRLEDVYGTLPPSLRQYAPLVEMVAACGPVRDGTGYLTIDEREVAAQQHHRRPGLHVDGWSDDGGPGVGGAWGGGGGGGWAGGTQWPTPINPPIGLLTVANASGCAAYEGDFWGLPHAFGDCEHLRPQARFNSRHVLAANRVYGFEPLTVHESVPLLVSCRRQFVRLSMPSSCGWPLSNTPNPLGILPDGPIWPARPEAFTRYEPRP